MIHMSKSADEDLTIHVGHEEFIIRQRCEVASIINDILIAIWFVIGSILFFNENTTTIGTWFLLLGSIQLLIRPVIRLTRRVHITRFGSPQSEAAHDF